MLVLSRRPNEKILLPAANVTVEVVSIKHGAVRLGIDAPRDMAVWREELWNKAGQPQASLETALKNGQEAALRDLRHLVRNRLNVAAIGLALLRRQIEAGLTREAGVTIERMANDLEMLQSRLDAPLAAPPGPAVRPARKTALVVEDDRNECELLAGFLRVAGVEVATAGDGADALDYLRTHDQPDFVVLDMLMPRCDGPTTVHSIRSDPHYASLKIFAVSGRSPAEFGIETGRAGIDRWFPKPLNPEALLRELNHEAALRA
jgi:carbon storage regulator CsrA